MRTIIGSLICSFILAGCAKNDASTDLLPVPGVSQEQKSEPVKNITDHGGLMPVPRSSHNNPDAVPLKITIKKSGENQ